VLAALAVRAFAKLAIVPAVAVGVALTVLAFVWASLMTPPGFIRIASFALGWVLVSLAVIDVAALRLPDAFTLPLLVAGLLVAALLPGRPVIDHVVGAAAGWGALAALAWIYRRARGRAGVGMGDAKLLGAAGAWLGWRALPGVILIACGLAFVWVGLRALTRGRAVLSEPIAFGAPLCLGLWITWLHGPL
jgi:leader peptidase (prepilin peptidase)/N-methyltransferase